MVTRVKRRPGPRPGHDYCTVSASNADTAGASAGPFGLSDTPDGSTTFGWDAGTFEVETTENLDASGSTHGMATIREEGLWPGMTFPLTCADLGYSATDFTVTDVVVTWFNGTPRYAITFGDPLVTMSVWLNSASAGILPITRTKITDGEVTTPKLAANGVTTDKLDAGSVTADKMIVGGYGVTLDNPGFETGDLTGWVEVAVSGGSVAADTTVPNSGKYRCSFTTTGTAGEKIVSSHFVPAVAGQVFSAGLYARLATGSPGVRLVLHCYDSSQTFLSVVNGTTQSVASGWNHYADRLTAPASTAFVRLGIEATTASAGFAVDDVTFAPGSVLIDSSGVTITNGALTVKQRAPRIGGTSSSTASNMFKIAATGTTDDQRLPGRTTTPPVLAIVFHSTLG